MNFIQFQHPWILLLIPICLTVLFLVSTKGKIGLKGWLSFTLRGLVIILLGTILAGIGFRVKSPDRCRLYLLDNSGSVFLNHIEILDAIQKGTKELKATDRVGLIVFGGDVSVEVPLVSPLSLKIPVELVSRINQAQTNIARALRTCMEIFPEGYQKEIMLISDGIETAGNTKDIIPLLQKQDIKLNTLAIGPRNLADLAIDEFYLPAIVPENQALSSRFTLSSTIKTEANLYLYEEGKLIKEWKTLRLGPEQQTKLGFQLPALDKAVQEYEAVLRGNTVNEICTANNSARGITIQRNKPSILYLSNANTPMTLEQIIRNNKYFQLDVKKSLDNLPLYDMVIFDDIPRKEINEEISGLKRFVEEGNGLLFMGGKHSYALGGYQGTALEEISPLWFSPQDNIGVIIILDRSGSMSEMVGQEGTKWLVARRALAEAMRLLSPKDESEIIVFNDNYEVVQLMQSIINQPERITELEKRLNQIQPNGATIILPQIKNQARQDLNKTTTALKHIILISDGTSTTGETAEEASKVGEELIQSDITISTIATGNDVDEKFLRNLTRDGKNGRYYRVTDFTKLVDFLKEDLSFYKKLYIEGNFKSEGKADSLPKSLPGITGYNCTSLKERTQLLATISNNDPLMAEWHYGKGKVVSFASSLNKEWCEEWLNWNELGNFWMRILQGIVPQQSDDKNLMINAALSDNQALKVEVTSSDKRYDLQLTAEIAKQKGFIFTKSFSQTSPAHYELTIPGLAEGSYLISVYDATQTKRLVKTIPFIIPYALEWRHFGINLPLLQELADKTDGKLLTNFEQNINISRTGLSYQNRDVVLLLVALGLLIVDLLVKLAINR